MKKLLLLGLLSSVSACSITVKDVDSNLYTKSNCIPKGFVSVKIEEFGPGYKLSFTKETGEISVVFSKELEPRCELQK